MTEEIERANLRQNVADDAFPRLISSILDSDTAHHDFKSSSSEFYHTIEIQWKKAVDAIRQRKVKQGDIEQESYQNDNALTKKARVFRLLSKSRSDIGFARKSGEQLWFLKKRSDMNAEDWKIMREDFGIQVYQTKCTSRSNNAPAHKRMNLNMIPEAIRCWEEIDMPESVYKVIQEDFQIPRPSPIQMQAIPTISTGKDVIARAETGSGKSIAFILPSILAVMHKEPTDSPFVINIAPTQELAKQLHSVVSVFTENLGLQCMRCIGGDLIQSNAAEIRRGMHCIVGTPGRIMDLLDGKMLSLRETMILAVDEADRCTDSGLIGPMKAIIDEMKTKSKRAQLLFFSATYGDSLPFISSVVEENSFFIQIGGSTSKNIQQIVELKGENIHETLTKLSTQYLDRFDPPMIIFCNSRGGCEALHARLDAQEIHSCVLHAGLSSHERSRIFSDFREMKTPILITTDALARGIDIANVSLVVNFEAPRGEDAMGKYAHRIGRTGRGGKSGVAVTFIHKDDTKFTYALRNYLIECDQTVPKEVERVYQAESTKVKETTK